MNVLSNKEVLDRHALVMAIWLAFGFVALVLLKYGFAKASALALLTAFGLILIAFVGHIIVNVVYRTTFTRGELALGLVGYAAGLVAFGVATLFSPGFGARHFIVVSAGFVALFAAVTFYMITHFGVRRVFDAFDTISDFRSADKSSGH